MKKKIYPYGLRSCEDMPQVYRLSHILASYKQGVDNVNQVTTTIGTKDDTIKDGSLDFYVPARYYPECGRIVSLIRRTKLAWQVFTGKASILYYK